MKNLIKKAVEQIEEICFTTLAKLKAKEDKLKIKSEKSLKIVK